MSTAGKRKILPATINSQKHGLEGKISDKMDQINLVVAGLCFGTRNINWIRPDQYKAQCRGLPWAKRE